MKTGQIIKTTLIVIATVLVSSLLLSWVIGMRTPKGTENGTK